jgi:hypothetical protein
VLIDRITTDAAGLRATSSSDTSGGHLEEFWTALIRTHERGEPGADAICWW